MSAVTSGKDLGNGDFINMHRILLVYNLFIIIYIKFYEEHTKDSV